MNAHSCPRCDFFLGYSTTRPSFDNRRTSVIGSCLSCDYRLPIHAVLGGERQLRSVAQRVHSNLQLIPGGSLSRPKKRRTRSEAPGSCARDLRAVGQVIEQLRLKNFNLRRDGRSYLIWDRDEKRVATIRQNVVGPNYRLSADDIERIERAGASQRSRHFHPVNGHRFSHLLRTLGAQVERRGQRLLGVAWHDQTIQIVVETAKGQRHIEPIRIDILYDLWVRMYLRRAR